jgi:steroid delta-isomerase-like uncharacterized protein
MTRDDMVRFFTLEQGDWGARNGEALASRYAQDATIVSPIFRTVKGITMVRESFQALFTMFPDWSYVGQRLLVDGDDVSQQFTVRATHSSEFMGLPGTGRPFEIQGVRLLQLKNGLIAHEQRYYDFTRFLAELGVLRIKPGRA